VRSSEIFNARYSRVRHEKSSSSCEADSLDIPRIFPGQTIEPSSESGTIDKNGRVVFFSFRSAVRISVTHTRIRVHVQGVQLPDVANIVGREDPLLQLRPARQNDQSTITG